MRTIKLINRYGYKNYLEEISDNIYKLVLTEDICKEHLYITYSDLETKEIYAIDVPGGLCFGNLLYLGCRLKDGCVNKIIEDNGEFLITIENDEEN